MTTNWYSRIQKMGDGLIADQMGSTSEAKRVLIPSPSFNWAVGGGLVYGKVCTVYGPEQCQPAGSKVLMANGEFKNIEDIKVGDNVLSPQRNDEYNFSTVLHTTSWFCEDMYTIKSLRKNNPILYSCSGNHIVPHTFLDQRKIPKTRKSGQFRVTRELTAKEIFSLKAGLIQNSHVVTCPLIAKFNRAENPQIDGYALGVYLGDGHLAPSGQVSLTNVNMGILDRLLSLGAIFPSGIRERKGNPHIKVVTLSKFHPWVKYFEKVGLLGKLSHDKFIPNEAKFSDLEYRQNLLTGLLDTDGYYDVKKNTYEYATVSTQLAKDVQFLVHSLGGYAGISERFTSYNKGGTKFKSYRLYIQLNMQLKMLNKYKRMKFIPYRRSNCRHQGFLIERSNPQQVYGFVLDSPSNWYVTDNYIITHNSGKSLIAQLAIASMHKEDPEAWALWYDAEFSFDSQYASKLGIDLKRLMVVQSNKPSDIFDHFVDQILPMLQDEEPFPLKIMVIDSIKSIRGPKEADKDSVEAQIMGDLSQLLQKAFRKIIPPIKQNKILLICVQQVSEEFDQTRVMQGHKWHVPSGMALKHASDYMILVEKVENKASKIFDETHKGISNLPIQLGHIIRCKVEKNRVNCPHLVAQFRLQYGVGVVDTELEVCELAVNIGVVNRPTQAAYEFEGIKVVGIANFVNKVKKDPKLYNALVEAINKTDVFRKREVPTTPVIEDDEE